MLEYAVTALAFALVTAVGAWLEWHSRREVSELRVRSALAEKALDNHATAILNLQGQISALEQQCQAVCAEAELAKDAAMEAATKGWDNGPSKRRR